MKYRIFRCDGNVLLDETDFLRWQKILRKEIEPIYEIALESLIRIHGVMLSHEDCV